MNGLRKYCNLCKSSIFKRLFTKSEYTFVKCKKCNLVFILEEPTEIQLRKYYDRDYYEGKVYNSYDADEPQRKRYYVQQLMYFENYFKSENKEILEIGSATGTFLDCARYFGYHVVGIEKSIYSANIAKSKNHEVYTRNLEELVTEKILEKDRFGAVFMWDVLEHLNDPDLTLKHINYLTTAGGLLVLNTLNIDSPTVKYLGKKWSHFLPPQHLFYYSLETLKKYLFENGFSILIQRTAGPLFYDDILDKYYIFKKIFSHTTIEKISNKLKLGYAQYVIAEKTKDIQ